jgi:ABC-type uncharacterized transport system substrate-binding protein
MNWLTRHPVAATTKLLNLAVMVIAVYLTAACSSSRLSTPTAHQATPRVLLLNSDQGIARYQAAQQAFHATINEEVVTVDLADQRNPAGHVQDLLNQNRFALVYCIGAKSLGIIDDINPAAPVVYSSVLNWRRFADLQRYHGIASEVPAATQLALLRYLFPEVRRIGVFHSADNRAWISHAQQIAGQLGLEIKAEEIRGPRWLERSDALLAKVDALWIISDHNTLASAETAKTLFSKADQAGRPVFAYHPFFNDLGSVVTISADLPTTGRQAAVLAMALLSNTIDAPVIQYPAGSYVTLNLRQVFKYRLRLNESALDSVDLIIAR